MECLFCEIVAGNVPSHKVWEDDRYLAFLTIFPNTKGVTVVVPKDHFPSYAFDLEDSILQDFIVKVKKVAKILDKNLPTNMRTALVFEGFGIDHVHAKLYPMHGKKQPGWSPKESSKDDYYKEYPGYIATHDSKRADDKELAELAKLLRES